MLQTSLLLMKSLNKTVTPIFLSVVCSLFPKAIFLTFIPLKTVLGDLSSHAKYNAVRSLRSTYQSHSRKS